MSRDRAQRHPTERDETRTIEQREREAVADHGPGGVGGLRIELISFVIVKLHTFHFQPSG